MNTYHFTILVRDANFDDTLEDKLFTAGCDDALVCTLNDIVYLEFDRVAETAKSAISSAFDDLNQAGFYDLVLQEKGVSTLAELAKRIGVSRTTFNHYTDNKKNNANFPKPQYGILSGTALYAWSEVANWLYQHNKLPKNDYEVAMIANEF